MDTFPTQSGNMAPFSGEKPSHETHSGPVMWRPWDTTTDVQHEPQKLYTEHQKPSDAKQSKSMPVTHPVKLYWPRTKCFDYLYQDAEMLLRSYPVQATICLYEEDSSGDEDSGDEEDEDDEDFPKEMN